MPNIIELMKKADISADQLDEIVIANGPGSYTGTRISVTTGKTLAWALQVPIYTVSSLKLIAAGGSCFEGLICPFIDARRATVYTGLYQSEKGKLKEIKQERHISMADWLKELESFSEPITFF